MQNEQNKYYTTLLLLLIIFVTSIHLYSYKNFDFSSIKRESQLAQVSSTLNIGLVVHYKFDEGSGATATDSAGSNTASLNGGVNWVAGNVGGVH